MVSDGGASLAVSLVEAAVRAAVSAGAPRRTVAATAAAVASAMAAGRGGDGALVGATEPSAASDRRKKKNRKKKERRKLAEAERGAQDGTEGTNGVEANATIAPTVAAEEPSDSLQTVGFGRSSPAELDAGSEGAGKDRATASVVHDDSQVLDDLGIERYCCRRMYVGHIELIDEISPFSIARQD